MIFLALVVREVIRLGLVHLGSVPSAVRAMEEARSAEKTMRR